MGAVNGRCLMCSEGGFGLRNERVVDKEVLADDGSALIIKIADLSTNEIRLALSGCEACRSIGRELKGEGRDGSGE